MNETARVILKWFYVLSIGLGSLFMVWVYFFDGWEGLAIEEVGLHRRMLPTLQVALD
jgi:hypothetical protein